MDQSGRARGHACREARGDLTRPQFEAKTGVPPLAQWRYEKGNGIGDPKHMHAYAKLGIPYPVLTGLVDRFEAPTAVTL